MSALGPGRRGGRGDKGSRAREEEMGVSSFSISGLYLRTRVLARLLAHSMFRNRGSWPPSLLGAKDGFPSPIPG